MTVPDDKVALLAKVLAIKKLNDEVVKYLNDEYTRVYETPERLSAATSFEAFRDIDEELTHQIYRLTRINDSYKED